MRIGLIQYRIGKDPEVNEGMIFKYLDALKRCKTELIILPEMALGAPSKASMRRDWVEFYKACLTRIKSWSSTQDIPLIFPGIEVDNRRYFNASTYIHKGRIIARYRKIYLFGMGGENRLYSSGENVCVFKPTSGGVNTSMGMVICYDIRFPELMRKMTRMGMKLLIVTAQWPESRRSHWLTLLKARAIENQVYVVGVNRLGAKQKLTFCGDSVVYDPWGRKIIHLGKNRVCGFADIDLGLVDRVRKKFPFLREMKVK